MKNEKKPFSFFEKKVIISSSKKLIEIRILGILVYWYTMECDNPIPSYLLIK
jgi:hypothetical protein